MKKSTLCLALVALSFGCGGSTSDGKSATGGTGGSGNFGGSGGASGGVGGGGSGGAVGGAGNTGGASAFKACSAPGTCELLPKNCCGYCTYTPISGYEAVNTAQKAAYLSQVCADPRACPDCITYEDPNQLALCRGGKCTEVDLLTDTLSACQNDTDCRLRWGTACCESCGGTNATLVSYNKNQNLEAEVCAPDSPPCPPCVPPAYPQYALPICSAGNCKVTIVGP